MGPAADGNDVAGAAGLRFLLNLFPLLQAAGRRGRLGAPHTPPRQKSVREPPPTGATHVVAQAVRGRAALAKIARVLLLGGRAVQMRFQRTAIGATVEPLPPWIFSGCIMKANSETPFAASSSSLRFSSR
jgi:hypothetical protein